MVMNHALVGARAPRRMLAVLVALGATIITLIPASMAQARGSRVDRVEALTVRYINAYRHSHGLGSVYVSRRMSSGADAHSHFMARHRYATHGAWASRVSHYAHSRTIGEVIGWLSGRRGQAAHIVRMWINSPPHRAVLLNGSYRRLGVARRRSGRTYFYTVDFAR
jgi:uncharacterized protein YkwD